jgi:hypothetical protein
LRTKYTGTDLSGYAKQKMKKYFFRLFISALAIYAKFALLFGQAKQREPLF